MENTSNSNAYSPTYNTKPNNQKNNEYDNIGQYR